MLVSPVKHSPAGNFARIAFCGRTMRGAGPSSDALVRGRAGELICDLVLAWRQKVADSRLPEAIWIVSYYCQTTLLEMRMQLQTERVKCATSYDSSDGFVPIERLLP